MIVEWFVQVLSFGSAWWVRPARDPNDPERYTRHAAYFNASGIVQGSKVHVAGPVRGLVRFHVNSGLDPHCTNRNLGKIFRAHPLEVYRQTNRLLILGPAEPDTNATHFLVALNSRLHGMILRDHPLWGTGVVLLALSRFRGRQEALCLLAPGASVPTTNGAWTVTERPHKLPQLVLRGEEDRQSHAI